MEKRRVMVIEDSPTQAERLRALMETDGLEVVHSPNAEAALDMIAFGSEKARPPDVILVDYHLPGMNGDEFCRAIRLNFNTRAIPILMLTVEGSGAAERRGLESGADDYLAKSEDPDILLARVRNLIRKSAASGSVLDIENRFSRARVLAVDDSPTYLQKLAQELSSEHYVVEKATNGFEALERLSRESFDCVLVDFEMPGINGAEICRRIEGMRREPGGSIVVIMLTSQDDKEHMTMGLEAGADDYIVKSADMAVIKARIRALMRRKFLIEENRRIIDEMRDKELQAVRARAEKEAAEERATLADQLAATNRELENANRRLAEALNVNRAITASAADALLTLDRQGLVSFMNPAAEVMFGIRSEDLVGHPLDDRLKLRGPDGVTLSGKDHPLTRCLENPITAIDVDGLLTRNDGTQVDVACSISTIEQDGAATGAVLVLHDVSERKRAELRLREAQKLESIGLLAGGIAHDFNNLLTGILGSASLAESLLPPGSKVVPLLRDVVTASERAAHLTRQMLAYSGKGRFIVELVDLSKLAHDISELLHASIGKNVTLHLDLAPELPAVEADAGQMQQVVMNLLLNAAEAIGDAPGEVMVRTGVYNTHGPQAHYELSFAEIVPGEYVFLEVKDTGCGMDESTRGKIFDPFFSTKFAGRGLGLAAVAGIVRSHRGAVKVVTSPGQGSTFQVLFPGKGRPAPRPLAPTAPVQEALDGSELILVVDDENLVLRTAMLALQSRGYQVLQAESGAKAVEIVKNEQRDVSLVLLDLSMPGMSGQDTLRELRRVRPDIDVVISSGYGEEEAMRLFQGQPVSGFIQKPYTAIRLLEKVKSILQGRRANHTNL